MTEQAHTNLSTAHPSHVSNLNPRTKRRWLWWVVFFFVVVFLAFAVWLHAKKKRQAAEAPVPADKVAVNSVVARSDDLPVYLDAIGTVTPVYTASITSQVTGVIVGVYYREGQLVRKGDPLIDLDPRPFEAQLGEARGTLQHDESVLAEAKMDLARYQQAWAKNGVSRQQLEDQEKVVLQDEGTVNYDRSALEYAQVQLGYCHIVAPISGRLGLRLVDPGNLVTANATTSLAVITQLQPTTVVFTLAQDDVARVQRQMHEQKALRVEAYDRVKSQPLGVGTLITIDNQIDTSTGTVKLRAKFDNPDNQLFANQFVNTRLLLTTLQNQILVPTSSIQHNGDTDFVFLIQNGRAAVKQVRVGAADGATTAVEGIEAGATIASSSFEKLQDGTEVTILSSSIPRPAHVDGGSLQ